jgi:hypothetical protein
MMTTLDPTDVMDLTHVLSIRISQFKSHLESEQSLSNTQLSSGKLVTYYKKEIARAEELIAKLNHEARNKAPYLK